MHIIFISSFAFGYLLDSSYRLDGKPPCIAKQMHLRCHARYLPRCAVEWKANCGGKIAPLQRRQVRCVCSISLPGWRKMLASAELPGNNSVCERSRGCISIYLARASGFRMYVYAPGKHQHQRTVNRVVLGALLYVVCSALFILYPRLVLTLSRSVFPLFTLPSCRGNMTIIRYEATGRRI